MSACIRIKINKLTLFLVIMLILSGLGLRSVLIKKAPVQPQNIEKRTTLKMAVFLFENDLPAAKSVHYTADMGIRGLQVSLPQCNGNLQIAIMPEGDEFLSIWQARSASVANTSSYLFNHHVYTDFPIFEFWWQTMSYSLAHRLQLPSYTNPGPVIAMAYPNDCPQLQTVPWQRFEAHG